MAGCLRIPLFIAERNLFEELGVYRLDYGSAADYELMLRFIHLHRSNVHYLNKVMVKMIVGGVSNKNIGNRVKAMRFDLRAMKNNNIILPWMTIFFKPIRKIVQYF